MRRILMIDKWLIQMLILSKRAMRNIFMRLDRLIEEALMTQKEVADETRLSPGTVSRMVNGHPTSRLSVRKVLALLSQKLGRRIEIEDVEGLNITNN
jgi:transcriptional regulator with XRE-family HTH domain